VEERFKTVQRILRVLIARFGTLPEGLAPTLEIVADERKLDDLLDYSARCPSLEALAECLKKMIGD
jgi:hypothetical protein